MLPDTAAHVLAHPGAFVVRVLKGFSANQGLLLAGAVAYYALLSVVPLLIRSVIALSHVIDQRERIERSEGAARFAAGRAQSPTTTPSRRGSAPPK